MRIEFKVDKIWLSNQAVDFRKGVNGFVLLYKRLDKGKFSVEGSDTKITINEKQLKWLLAGLDWQLLGSWDKADFKDYF